MSRMHPNLVKQIQLEEETWNVSLNKYDNKLAKLIETGAIQDSKEVILIVKATIDTLSSYIDEYLSLDLRGNNKKVQMFLKDTFGTADNIAYVIIKTLLSALLKGGATKSLAISKHIVKVMSNHGNIQLLKEERPKLFSFIERHNKRKGDSEVKKQKCRMSAKVITQQSVSGDIAKLLGTTCIDLAYKSGCNLITIYKDKDTSYNVELSNDTKQLFMRSKAFFGNLITAYYPLVYPPKDWESINGSGGYWTQKDISFIKCRTKKDFNMIMATQPDLTRLMKIVNDIQSTPYKINRKVYDTIQTIIKYNIVDDRSTVSNPILCGEIPYMNTLNIHELVPKSDYGKLNEDGKFINVEDKKKWLKAMDDQDTKIRRIESKRLAFKMALETATKFKDEDRIYFSYTLDFRGRLYPIQSYLNPQSSDNIKSMLQFADGQYLTKEGEYWLKIHGANCYGYDKLTYEDRIAKIDEMIPTIKLIAKDPISNLKLWYDVDSPLLFLAFCFAFMEHLEGSMVYIPVQLDATCSGIQIYSGLLKDKRGAKAVNVISSDRVNDIYQDVANKVEEYLANNDYPRKITYTTKDGEEHTRPTLVEADSIKGKITRKLTKRNVMTQPYSVTKRGMYEQVYELLSEYEDSNQIFWKGDKWVVATLISKLNDKAIGEVVQGARRGQEFIKEVLRQSLQREDSAFWLSPIYDFPVLQRIKREKRQRLRTPLGQLVLYHPTDETHYIKMLNGIAPNYIHSLDCTLLYRTVERCKERGVNSFWLIHDSYGVLPNDVPILNVEVREAYIELFKGNPLADWVSQILPEGINVIDKVMINDLDLNEVRNSRYIFS